VNEKRTIANKGEDALVANSTQKRYSDEFPTPKMERSYSTPRTAIGLALTVLAFLLLGVALLPLFLVIAFVIIKGANRLNLELFTGSIPVALLPGGGIAPAIVGTLMVAISPTRCAMRFRLLRQVWVSSCGANPAHMRKSQTV